MTTRGLFMTDIIEGSFSLITPAPTSVPVETGKETAPLSTYTHDEYLAFAQSRRLKFVQAMEKACQSDEGLATLDPDRQSNYLAAIRDIEKQVFTQQKLKQEEEDSEVRNAMIAALIVKQAASNNVQRSQRQVNQIIPDPTTIPQKKLIPGETEIGDRIENYREYKLRTGQGDNLDPEFPSFEIQDE